MMDIFFTDPAEIPLPPDEVRIRALHAEPFPDGRRVRVSLELDPFQRRPNADITLRDAQGAELAAASIIETMSRKLEFVMHLRYPPEAAPVPGPITARAVLFYSTAKEEPGPESNEPPQYETTVVDQTDIQFDLPQP